MQRAKRQRRSAAPIGRARQFRALPGMTKLLQARAVRGLTRRHGEALVRELLRETLDALREQIRAGTVADEDLRRAVTVAGIARAVERRAEALLAPRPRAVINATGVIVHTNLGRSLLSERAAARVADAARRYVDLEYDVQAGRRGSRLAHLEPLLARLFPGQGFVLVNNNAAALLLCLHALARRREVLVSRGELVEIGGSFRVPDILAASGARLREVGTTNRTRLADYESALGPRTGALLKVHTSNFRIVGFTEETPIPRLAELGRRSGLPLIVDWGSGDLVDLGPFGIHDELPVARVLEAGADLVTFSGDKLLGGPQAGFVVGRRELIERLRKDPLARVCRLDRLLIAALHETLSAYVSGRALEVVPTLRMLALGPTELGRRAEALRRRIARQAPRRWSLRVIDGVSRTGGGSSPTGERPTRLLAIGADDAADVVRFERRLREGQPAVVARIHDGRLLLDPRTVLPEQDAELARCLIDAMH